MTNRLFRRPAGLAVLGLALLGCVGDLGDEDDDGGGDGAGAGGPGNGIDSFACDASLIPASVPLRRLSKVQYRNAIRDLVTELFPVDADLVRDGVEPMFQGFPNDKRSGPLGDYGAYTRLDQTVHQETVDATYTIGTFVGKEATSTDERLSDAVGDCATNGDGSDDDACLDDFISRFGERALRRPLTDEDIAFYRDVAGPAPFEPADYADVIGMLLMAPELVYFVENGTGDGEVPAAALSDYELASRLSFHFWQTIPDAQLMNAARTGALSTPEGYDAEVERLLDDPRTREAVATFFSEWLYKEDLGELDSRVGTPVFDAFAGDFVPGPDLRERMFGELTDMGVYYSLDSEGTFESFFESNQSFARTDDLATLYGVPVWDGESAPPAFTDSAHAGLITRAALVATGSANTRPIMKGVFLRKALLCDDIPPPPDNAAGDPPELSPTATTREVVEQITQQEGSQCSGCHATRINPLGFATENFDALGRIRTEQTLFDSETGEVIGSKPVDTTSQPRVTSDDGSQSTGATDLSRLMVDSGVPQACFVRQYFRFTFGRAEDVVSDGCGLASMHERVLAGDSLRSVLREVAFTTAFKMRSFD
ncbi:MAG: DUF1592 domain-containing protein [Polyangiaceae bacterium]|nr:DUF1592 domain-containing protein [Polyangiaceae bacterium]